MTEELSKEELKRLQKKFQEFEKAPKYNLNSEEVFCICRKPDDEGQLMVACDGCDEWFHFRCMKLDPKYEKLVANFYCVFCDRLFNKGKTLWKRKCKLEGCFNPIELSEEKKSKYCSEEHGLMYMKQALLDKVLKQEDLNGQRLLKLKEVSSILREVDDCKALAKLGEELPIYSDFYPDAKLSPHLTEKVAAWDKQIQQVTTELERLDSRLRLVLALKEFLKLLNENINIITIPDYIPGPRTKSSKSKSKNSKKSDICGFNRVILDLDRATDMDQFKAKISPYLGKNAIDPEDFKKLYREIYPDDDDMVDSVGPENWLARFCLKDKRKCNKHHSWLNILADDYYLQTQLLEEKKKRLQDERQTLMTDYNIERWSNLEAKVASN
ncbi:COMPASS component [Komagataella phaffii CBS 7435]|uniref:Subunit of COMPASS (Set1C), a complex which methylates histone H3 on lysine 4 and is required in tel n=2 Tax=Komagataella phaffii TaxID=460519 RepID=C4QZZ0_KOMPG|nr:Subunit of COMPASS (Set1C), a complex which methylates histone H3 on lysine 4 and is required in tel [Komagataella phaffii GS115]AOA62968.1 GQ67_00234T0 [Komagataella phaffii]CAH2448685.1 COMPASS component [Komagataella phaffii CBS 7435]AOA66994.1 GQ68_01154T0 [Komagataella phaffii GS115]CAY68814.1 Subunit of COMPASS (Set1C), a complex which methylates histone H3 on lysine 4 and is required in tel [Komagataella phaffii GS115]CCA38778.1 COMPASS component [Komagataella phaffii CBS 7435]